MMIRECVKKIFFINFQQTILEDINLSPSDCCSMRLASVCLVSLGAKGLEKARRWCVNCECCCKHHHILVFYYSTKCSSIWWWDGFSDVLLVQQQRLILCWEPSSLLFLCCTKFCVELKNWVCVDSIHLGCCYMSCYIHALGKKQSTLTEEQTHLHVGRERERVWRFPCGTLCAGVVCSHNMLYCIS